MKKRLQVGSATGVPKNTSTFLKKKALNTTTPKTNSFPTWSDTPADIT